MSATSAVHAPAHAAALAELVRDAATRGVGLRLRGAGGWRELPPPADDVERCDLSALKGVREYTPGDLTIAVGAGTTLAELDEVTRAHGQWCPLLPWGDDGGTIGATIATATAGPFAAALGRPRDLAIGLECVDGNGRTVRAGGRVVKNVAGFDLVRLMTGQWGTLGAITGVNLRLRARPAVDASVRLNVHGESTAERQRLAEFARGPLAPVGCVELGDGRWLVRFGGNASFVHAGLAALRSFGDLEEVAAGEWDAVRRDRSPRPALDAWRWDEVSQRIKRRFDPHDVLNRGLLGAP